MSATVTPKKRDVYDTLRAFIQNVVGGVPPVQVITGLGNRVPMPADPFIAITAIGMYRLETNVDTDIDPYPASGITNSQQATRIDVQLDFYGPKSNSWATMIQTLFRDEYACLFMGSTCQPLWADDPIMMPLITGERQYLERWTVAAALQFNPVTSTAQSFSTTLAIGVIDVDVKFPPKGP